jgi:hypothetical protein
MSDLPPNPATHNHGNDDNTSAKAPQSPKSQAKILGAGDELGAGEAHSCSLSLWEELPVACGRENRDN